jgi:proteasome lid subunit RPN8/RPN11
VKQLKAEVLELAFEHFRRCGAGQRECIVYMTSEVENPELIDGVIHPIHSAGPAGYDLDSDAIAVLWRDLLVQQRSIQMQVHTHPGVTYHSSRDDALALVNSTGALSLVIPDFALGPVGLREAFLARSDENGGWVEVPIAQNLEVVR